MSLHRTAAICAWGTKIRDQEKHGLPENAVGVSIRGLLVIIGYALPCITLAAFGNKLMVINGIHKLFTLHQMGIQQVPAAVIREPRVEDFPRETPIDQVLLDPRPPLLKDFFDPRMTIDLQMKPYKRAIRVKVDIEELDVPV